MWTLAEKATYNAVHLSAQEGPPAILVPLAGARIMLCAEIEPEGEPEPQAEIAAEPVQKKARPRHSGSEEAFELAPAREPVL